MSDERPSEPDSAETQELKAQALIVSAIATLTASYVALGCLLPIVALVFVTVGFVYGGGAAVLAVLVPGALVALLIYWLAQRK